MRITKAQWEAINNELIPSESIVKLEQFCEQTPVIGAGKVLSDIEDGFEQLCIWLMRQSRRDLRFIQDGAIDLANDPTTTEEDSLFGNRLAAAAQHIAKVFHDLEATLPHLIVTSTTPSNPN